MLTVLLISKYSINEEYIKKICDPAFLKNDTKKSLGEEIFEEKTKLETEFIEKYVQDKYSIYSVKEAMLNRYN